MNTQVSRIGANPLTFRVSAAAGGPDLGQIVRGADERFTVTPAAGTALAGLGSGPYPDLGAAMAAISAHLGGTCLYASRRR